MNFNSKRLARIRKIYVLRIISLIIIYLMLISFCVFTSRRIVLSTYTLLGNVLSYSVMEEVKAVSQIMMMLSSIAVTGAWVRPITYKISKVVKANQNLYEFN